MAHKPIFQKRMDRMFKIMGDSINQEAKGTLQGIVLDTYLLLNRDYQDYLSKTPFDDRLSFGAWLFGTWEE